MKKSIILINICLIIILNCVSNSRPQAAQPTPEPEPTETPEPMIIPDAPAPDSTTPQVPTAAPVLTPVPEPTAPPAPVLPLIEPGTVRIDLSSSRIKTGETVQAKLILNSGNMPVAAYGFTVTYNPAVLSLPATDAAVAGKDGYVHAVNAGTPGQISIAGFDVNGAGPGLELEMVIINFLGSGAGTDTVTVLVKQLVDLQYKAIGVPMGLGATITVD